MRLIRVLICAALVCSWGGCDRPPAAVEGGMGGSAEDPVVYVAENDPEMAKAIADARTRLPEFWTKFDSPMGETDFALKVEISDANGTEFFWCTPIEKRGGKIYGTINNDPGIVRSVKFGETIEIAPDKIADWNYTKNEKMYGNFTLRPLLKDMPPEEAAQFRSMLAEP
jgi:uncharacterized protein YegJ (DUF2314 family)